MAGPLRTPPRLRASATTANLSEGTIHQILNQRPRGGPRARPFRSVSIDRARVENVREILPSIIDALTDAVVVVDRERRVVAANRRYSQVFASGDAGDVPECADPGCAGGRGRMPSNTRSSRGAESERCAVCEVFEKGEPLRILKSLPDARGAVARWEATCSPITGADGRVTHVVQVWREITERSRLEVQLSHSERLASVGLLAAGVAHEINNPLASMLAGIEGLARWLARGSFAARDLDEARETVEMLDHEVARCRETTEKLMLLGRSYDTTPGWVDLNRAVRDTLALLRYELRKRDIEAIEDLDPELPQIWAREAGIRGICMNLTMNAVQAIHGGGRLTLVTRHADEGATLTVEDTGPGIAPENLERIWDPFFTTKPPGQGTGLGLSITSRIVTRHGGRIYVEGAPGGGARFVVELPIHGAGGDS